jgi:hypothetical protein
MLVADRESIADASNAAANSSSYQLGQFVNAPRRNDPYSPGQRDHGGAAAMSAKLEAMLPSLQKSGRSSEL